MFGYRRKQPPVAATCVRSSPCRAEIDFAWRDLDCADAERRAACKAAFDAYVPTGPAFKIVQVPVGHYEIHRRRVERADRWERAYPSLYFLRQRDCMPARKAADVRAESTMPGEVYEPILNDKAPIGGGYVPLIFNVFADAEAYLKRMLADRPNEVGYDYPPLKRRAK
jgi:hypothetical protein